MFRFGTLYSLLAEVPSTIGRMARPNNIVERHRRRGSNNQSYSGFGRSPGRAEGSLVDDSNMSDDRRGTLNLKRRGTVNLVKNFMFSKIQKAQQSGFQDGSSMNSHALDGNSAINNRQKTHNFSMAPVHQRSALAGVNGNMRQGTLSPGNRTGNN